MNQWMGHFLSYLQEKASGLGLGVDAEFVETVLERRFRNFPCGVRSYDVCSLHAQASEAARRGDISEICGLYRDLSWLTLYMAGRAKNIKARENYEKICQGSAMIGLNAEKTLDGPGNHKTLAGQLAPANVGAYVSLLESLDSKRLRELALLYRTDTSLPVLDTFSWHSLSVETSIADSRRVTPADMESVRKFYAMQDGDIDAV